MPNRPSTRTGPLPPLPTSAAELAELVLRTAVREYTAGHCTDSTRTATEQDRAAYQQALYEHYTAVRAYMRATAKEPSGDA